MAGLPVAAIVNTNPELVEMLKAHRDCGLCRTGDARRRQRAGLDVGGVLAQHDPVVIVYDVVLP